MGQQAFVIENNFDLKWINPCWNWQIRQLSLADGPQKQRDVRQKVHTIASISRGIEISACIQNKSLGARGPNN